MAVPSSRFRTTLETIAVPGPLAATQQTRLLIIPAVQLSAPLAPAPTPARWTGAEDDSENRLRSFGSKINEAKPLRAHLPMIAAEVIRVG